MFWLCGARCMYEVRIAEWQHDEASGQPPCASGRPQIASLGCLPGSGSYPKLSLLGFASCALDQSVTVESQPRRLVLRQQLHASRRGFRHSTETRQTGLLGTLARLSA